MRTTKGLIIAGALLALVTLSACSAAGQPAAATSEPVSGTWIDASVVGDVAGVPLDLVMRDRNTHFSLETGGRTLVFMAYVLDEEVQVRANVCPPCRSRGFSLDGTTLVCDTCQTTFDARDGSGIEGACVDYPKAAVRYGIVDGTITMALVDLENAYDETLTAG